MKSKEPFFPIGQALVKAAFLCVLLFLTIGAGPVTSEAELNTVLDNFTKILNPYVQEQKHVPFLATGDWKKEYNEVSSGGSFYYPQPNGVRHLGVHVTGWLVRYEHFNRDEIEVVLCHETGHHFKGGGDEYGADYFVTKNCLPLLWAGQNHEEKLNRDEASKLLNPATKMECSKHPSESYCLRAALAMFNVGRFREWVWTKRHVPIKAQAENECRMKIFLHGMFGTPYEKCDE